MKNDKMEIKEFAAKHGVAVPTLRRLITREQMIRGEHYCSPTGSDAYFVESKAVARLQELKILDKPPVV